MRFRRRALTGELATAVTASRLEDLTAAAPRPVATPGALRKGQRPVAVIKVSRLWPTSQRNSTAAQSSHSVTAPDGLDAFGSESEPGITSPPLPIPVVQPQSVVKPQRRVGRMFTWAAVIVLSSSAAAGVTWQYQRRATAVATGSLTIQTIPSGVDVFIAGAPTGRTPLTVSLLAGSYDVQVGQGSQRRDLEVAMVAGGSVVHQLELASAVPAPAAPTGSLRVQTDPVRMSVLVDGVARGYSPLTIGDLPPGDHQVVVRGERGTVRRSVKINAQETLSLVISPIESTAVLPGWLAVSSPVSLQLLEAGKLIGTSDADKLMLPSGDHEIEFANLALGYRSVRNVNVAPGKVTTTAIELPSGVLYVNAQPWAEVWVDGERVGETPLANISRRIGPHEIVLRHPQFGERRERVVLTATQPTRLGVDMRRQ
jgi:PEGA domain